MRTDFLINTYSPVLVLRRSNFSKSINNCNHYYFMKQQQFCIHYILNLIMYSFISWTSVLKSSKNSAQIKCNIMQKKKKFSETGQNNFKITVEGEKT